MNQTNLALIPLIGGIAVVIILGIIGLYSIHREKHSH